MATLTTQRERDTLEGGYLLVVESLPYAWTDVEGLVGSTSYLGGSRTIKAGLEVPESLRVEADIRGGMLEDTRAVFGLVDLDGTVASMFAANLGQGALESITERLAPTEDTAPSTKQGPKGSITIRDRYVGPEYIDGSGNRRARYIVPSASGQPPGWDHRAVSNGEGPPVAVGQVPHVFAGLRVGLHRILVDLEDGSIPSWADQVSSGSLIWQGRLVDRARVRDMHTWELEVQGPDSWLRGELNGTNPAGYFPIRPYIDLEANEAGIAVYFEQLDITGTGGISRTVYESSIFDPANDLSSTDAGSLLTEIQTLISNTIAGTSTNYAGSGASFDSIGGAVSFAQDSLKIQVNETSGDNEGVLTLVMHSKVWAALGWDPTNQDGFPGGPFSMQTGPVITAADQRREDSTTSGVVLDAPGYVYASFTTKNVIAGEWPDFDNAGAFKVYRPAYASGAVSLQPQGGQTIFLGLGIVEVEGQKAQAPAAGITPTPSTSSAVDAMGWLHVRGEVLRGESFDDPNAERVEVNQVALVAWKNSAGQIAGTPGPLVYVVRWEDPRAFGFEERRISVPLTVGGSTKLEAGFIARLGGYQPAGYTYPDQIWRTIPRILLSSGTATTWSGTTPPTAGENHPAAATGELFWAGDLEVSALGLNIEAEAVDVESWRLAAAGLPGGRFGPMAQCLYARVGPMQAADIIASAHASRGWAVGMSKASGGRPKYRAFEAFRPITAAEVEVSITDADLAAPPDHLLAWFPGWSSRPFPPVDTFELRTRDQVSDDSLGFSTRKASLDRGRRARTGQVVYRIEDPGLSAPSFYDGNDDEEWKWDTEATTLWGGSVGPFLASRLSVLELVLSHPKGQFCYPGTAVRVDNSFAQALDGSGPGLEGALGRVLSSEFYLRGTYAGCTRVRILVQESGVGDGEGGRMWAGMARASSITSTGGSAYDVVVEADAWGVGHGESDARAFEEPGSEAIGGTVSLDLVQSYDGATWDNVVAATLVSVDTGTHTIGISVTSGTLRTDAFTIVRLADYDTQAASNWPRTLLSVVTNLRGTTFGSGPTSGWRLD